MPPYSLSIPPRELTRVLAARDTLTPNRLTLSEPVVIGAADADDLLLAAALAPQTPGRRCGRPGGEATPGPPRAACRLPRHHLPVYLGEIAAEDVRVELYADPAGTAAALALALTRGAQVAGAVNGFTYTDRVVAARPRTDFTVRVVPYPAEARVPTEPPLIRWQE
ncbi:MAG: hypothetical protein HIU82_01940 [Proteobacteria bacterium]|nr:hypothetical protein [Pseudomonadota bacterium]